MTTPWWARWPDRRAYEFDLLDAVGYEYTVDRAAERLGVLRLEVVARVAGFGDVELTVIFPDNYPSFRPVVRLRGERQPDMGRHLHPFGLDLCLLGRHADEWWPSDTVAELLTTQLPKLFRTSVGEAAEAPPDEEIRALEQVQAEPFSAFYTCQAPGAMLLDSAWRLPAEADEGRLRVGLRVHPIDDQNGVAILGAVLALASDHGEYLATLDRIPSAARAGDIGGRWVRLAEAIDENTPDGIAREVEQRAPGVFTRAGWQVLPETREEVQLVGVAFPEEREHRDGSEHDGWLFVLRRRLQHAGKATGRGASPGRALPTVVLRAGYIGAHDLTDRVPELRGLHRKHVAIVGLGAVGGFLAEHLARAGVGTLTLVDHDVVDPATLPRHVAGVEHSGWLKPFAVAARARSHNPFLVTRPRVLRVGLVRDDPSTASEHELLDEILDGVDLIVDATAARTPALLLSRLAAKRHLPFIEATTTNGAWGGRVVVIRPGVTAGCYGCLLHTLYDEDTAPDGAIAQFSPPSAPTDDVQPVGCAEPTFTGTGFDIGQVSLLAVRVAIGVLQTGTSQGYPALAEDVFVLELRDPAGRPLAPTWSQLPLPQHPRCVAHTAESADA